MIFNFFFVSLDIHWMLFAYLKWKKNTYIKKYILNKMYLIFQYVWIDMTHTFSCSVGINPIPLKTNEKSGILKRSYLLHILSYFEFKLTKAVTWVVKKLIFKRPWKWLIYPNLKLKFYQEMCFLKHKTLFPLSLTLFIS